MSDHSNIEDANREIGRLEEEVRDLERDRDEQERRAVRAEADLSEARQRITLLENTVSSMKNDADWSLNVIEDVRTRLASASNDARRAA